MKTKASLSLILLGALAACGAGAAYADSPAAAAAIAFSQSTYEQAQQAGGMSAAPIEMQSAQTHLNEARAAASKGDPARAQRIAELAEADAQLAIAKAREQTAQNSARQVQDGLATLRTELNQSAGAAAAGAAGAQSTSVQETSHDRS